jgi:hypothetical protein
MRRCILFLLFLTAVFGLFPQKAMTFRQAENSGLRVSKLDSLYPSGLHTDSSQSVFHKQQDEFIAAYQSMLQDLGKYLKANGFSWEKPTAGFNRIYFNGEGTIDYFLYNFRKGEITEEKEKQFDVLLNKYIKTYKFPLKAKSGFAQCSPVKYMN